MLSFRTPSFHNHRPIDYYMTSCQDPLLHGLCRFEQDRRNFAQPTMPIKTWSLESMPEALLSSDAAGNGIRVNSNKTPQEPAVVPAGPSSAPSRYLMHKRGQGTPLRSFPYSGVGNEISSFDLEYALLEHALRKDGNSLMTPRPADEGRSRKCPSPPLLEPEFYFGDILGDEAVPPQPLANICKEEDRLQEDVEDHMEETSNFASYQYAPPLSDPDHAPSTNIYKSDRSENPDTDLSTALASLVSSHVSSESISPTDVAERNANPMEIPPSEKKAAPLSKRRVPDTDMGTAKKISRQSRNSDWPPTVVHIHEPFQKLESDRRSATADLLSGDQLGLSQPTSVNDSAAVFGNIETIMHSPVSDSSMTGPGIRSHPDLYENLSEDIREKVDRLRQKISSMPRRKLRESLADGVTLQDVEPLMCLNRDELAGMLGLGVTTLKMFVHNTLGVPRWPARALKSQQVKVQKLVQKKMEAERKGDQELAKRVQRDLTKLTHVHMRRRKLPSKDAMLPVEGGIRKKDRL